jgi:Tol biopolymer transport system component
VRLRAFGADRGATRFEAVATWLALWIVGGLYLAGWAVQTGEATNATFSLYHVPGYLGLIALAAVVAERMFDRSIGAGPAGRVRSAWTGRTAGERVIVVGTIVLLTFVVSDVIWTVVLGIGTGLEARQAPTRLLLPLGLVLVASGWLVGADVGGHRLGWLGVVSATTILGALGFWIGTWHPVFSPWSARSPLSATDLRTEIWTMHPDGSLQTRIVPTGSGEVSEPAWSPDGRQLVYAGWSLAEDGSRLVNLWIANADGTGARQITSDSEWDWLPAWSPNGQWIAFTSRSTPEASQPGAVAQPQPGGVPATATESGDWSIFLVRPDGSERLRLTDGGQSMAPVWSPDGSKLAYHGTRDGNLDVFVANADGTQERRITQDPGDDWSPAWSPDGTRLVFTSNRAGNDDVWEVSVTGGAATQLTHDRAADQVPVWSPDGSRIAFVSDRTGDVEVWSMAPDGTDVTNLTQSPGSDDGRWSVAYSPDGSRIAFARWSPPPLVAEPLVRDDLGFLGMLAAALSVAIVVLVVDALGGLPLGGLTVAIGVSTAIIAAVSDGWRFIPAGVLAGGLADLVAWRLSGWRRRIALTVAVPATLVAALLVTVSIVDGLGWSISLAAGAVVAAALLGLGLAAVSLVGRPAERPG